MYSRISAKYRAVHSRISNSAQQSLSSPFHFFSLPKRFLFGCVVQHSVPLLSNLQQQRHGKQEPVHQRILASYVSPTASHFFVGGIPKKQRASTLKTYHTIFTCTEGTSNRTTVCLCTNWYTVYSGTSGVPGSKQEKRKKEKKQS